MVVDRVHRVLQMIFVEVARGDHLTIVLNEKRLRVARPLHAPADDAKINAIGRTRATGGTRGAAGQDEWQRDGRRRGGDKMSAADAG